MFMNSKKIVPVLKPPCGGLIDILFSNYSKWSEPKGLQNIQYTIMKCEKTFYGRHKKLSIATLKVVNKVLENGFFHPCHSE